MDNDNLQPGQRVKYYQLGEFYGYGNIIDKDIENGYIVYDVTLDNGKTKWGYADQFKVVVDP